MTKLEQQCFMIAVRNKMKALEINHKITPEGDIKFKTENGSTITFKGLDHGKAQ